MDPNKSPSRQDGPHRSPSRAGARLPHGLQDPPIVHRSHYQHQIPQQHPHYYAHLYQTAPPPPTHISASVQYGYQYQQPYHTHIHPQNVTSHQHPYHGNLYTNASHHGAHQYHQSTPTRSFSEHNYKSHVERTPPPHQAVVRYRGLSPVGTTPHHSTIAIATGWIMHQHTMQNLQVYMITIITLLCLHLIIYQCRCPSL